MFSMVTQELHVIDHQLDKNGSTDHGSKSLYRLKLYQIQMAIYSCSEKRFFVEGFQIGIATNDYIKR